MWLRGKIIWHERCPSTSGICRIACYRTVGTRSWCNTFTHMCNKNNLTAFVSYINTRFSRLHIILQKFPRKMFLGFHLLICRPTSNLIITRILLFQNYIHYGDVIMGEMASQITSLTIVYSTVYSGTDHTKHQSSASLAFVREIHRWPRNSPPKWPVTRKMFPFDDVIMTTVDFSVVSLQRFPVCLKFDLTFKLRLPRSRYGNDIVNKITIIW